MLLSSEVLNKAVAVAAGLLPPVQKAAFALFPTLVPLQSQVSWRELFHTLLRLLRPHLLTKETSTLEEQLQQEQQVGLAEMCGVS